MKILAISGSLRSGSTNTAALQTAAQLAPAGVRVELWPEIGNLPHFNPDLDTDPPLAPVAEFRAALRAADAVMICSPEYAHGVAGVMKNALDWVVGSGELIDKPVALINASPYATIAHAALAETLRTMSARVLPEASVTLPVRSGKPEAPRMLADPEISAALRSAIQALVQARQAQADSSTVNPAAR